MNKKENTLNEVLQHYGYTKRDWKNNRKDILKNGNIVLNNVTANEVWQFLAKRGESNYAR